MFDNKNELEAREEILAGASVDDVYVIVLFSTFVGMMQGEGASILKFVNIPISIFLGIAIGLLIGVLLAYFFKKMHIRDTSKVLIILSISFLLVVMEDKLSTPITFSALIAIMFIGIGCTCKNQLWNSFVYSIAFIHKLHHSGYNNSR